MTRILIIEDTKDLRDDVIEMLTLEGYEAFGAENGSVGVDMAYKHKPDLIVCDVMMPEMDGYEVLANLRGNAATAAIPFIFLTARTDRVNVRQGMVLGADDYLTKPFLVSELLDSITSQLKKRAELNKSAETRMNELRESIITALPHELRTPLNTIIGFSDMLMMEAQRLKPDQVVDWSSHINQAGQRLYRLMENYLYYARLQIIAEAPEKRAAYDDATLMNAHELLYTMALKIAQKYNREADLHVELESVASIQCMHTDMVKIADELMDNAFKFSPANTPITITGTIQGQEYEIKIEDKGRGISPEQIERIGAYIQFDRWFYEQQGMGLGLVIVQQIVKLYRGRVKMQGELNKGVTVAVTLNVVE
jgi:two-component system, sensor histidine kinase and response regulator